MFLRSFSGPGTSLKTLCILTTMQVWQSITGEGHCSLQDYSHFRHQLHIRDSQATHTADQLGTNSGVPLPPRFSNSLDNRTQEGTHNDNFTRKDTNQDQQEKRCKQCSLRGPKLKASGSLGRSALLACQYVITNQNNFLPTLAVSGVFII